MLGVERSGGRQGLGGEKEGAGSLVLGKVEGALCRRSYPEQLLGPGRLGVGKWLKDDFGIPSGAGRRDLLNDASDTRLGCS